MKMDTPPVIVKKTLPNSLAKNSLTPCRRVGLGRPTSGSLKKLMRIRTVSTPPLHGSSNIENTSSSTMKDKNVDMTLASNLPPSVSVQTNDGQNKVRRCLTQKIKSNDVKCVKRAIIEKEEKTEDGNTKIGSLVDHANVSGENHLKKIKSDVSSPYITAISGVNGNNNLTLNKTDSMDTFENSSLLNESEEISEEIIVKLVLSLIEKKKEIDLSKVKETYAKKHNLEELQGETAKWRTAGQEALRHCVRLARQIGHSVTVPQLMEQHGFPLDLMGYNADDDEFE